MTERGVKYELHCQNVDDAYTCEFTKEGKDKIDKWSTIDKMNGEEKYWKQNTVFIIFFFLILFILFILYKALSKHA